MINFKNSLVTQADQGCNTGYKVGRNGENGNVDFLSRYHVSESPMAHRQESMETLCFRDSCSFLLIEIFNAFPVSLSESIERIM